MILHTRAERERERELITNKEFINCTMRREARVEVQSAVNAEDATVAEGS